VSASGPGYEQGLLAFSALPSGWSFAHAKPLPPTMAFLKSSWRRHILVSLASLSCAPVRCPIRNCYANNFEGQLYPRDDKLTDQVHAQQAMCIHKTAHERTARTCGVFSGSSTLTGNNVSYFQHCTATRQHMLRAMTFESAPTRTVPPAAAAMPLTGRMGGSSSCWAQSSSSASSGRRARLSTAASSSPISMSAVILQRPLVATVDLVWGPPFATSHRSRPKRLQLTACCLGFLTAGRVLFELMVGATMSRCRHRLRPASVGWASAKMH